MSNLPMHILFRYCDWEVGVLAKEELEFRFAFEIPRNELLGHVDGKEIWL